MNRLPLKIRQLGFASLIQQYVPKGKSCWLVGGAVRDDILGRQPDDFDFAFDFDPTGLARALTTRLEGTLVPLDPERHQSRIVFFIHGDRYTFDLSPLRAPSLQEDLSLRDYTCNALACDLNEPSFLIDPLGGERDLLAGILRSCSKFVLKEDPLRIVKGIRHAVELNLALHKEVDQQFIDYRERLKNVAKERTTSELGRIFSHNQVHVGASLLEKFELLAYLDGKTQYSLDLSGLNGLLSAEKRFVDAGLFSGFTESVEENWPLYALVRFCRAVDINSTPVSRPRFTCLKQSKKALSIVDQLSGLSRLVVSSGLNLDTARKRALWLDSFRPSPLAAALYGASCLKLSPIDFIACLSDWLSLNVNGRVPDLICPNELVSEWGVMPGEDLGRGLSALRYAEITGQIPTDFDKGNLVRDYFKKN